jgi:hypothetical protein
MVVQDDDARLPQGEDGRDEDVRIDTCVPARVPGAEVPSE